MRCDKQPIKPLEQNNHVCHKVWCCVVVVVYGAGGKSQVYDLMLLCDGDDGLWLLCWCTGML